MSELARGRCCEVSLGPLVWWAVFAGLAASATAAQSGTTVRISESAAGVQGNGTSIVHFGGCTFTPDGRWVCFSSVATNLVGVPTGFSNDVFLRDLGSGTIDWVSIGNLGNPANSFSGPGYLSPDARYVYFGSDASNLVDGDTNDDDDIFIRDRVAATTVRVSLAWDGTEANNGTGPFRIAAGSRMVVFESTSTNLVPGDTNHFTDVFVRDIDASTTERVSISSTGDQGNHDSYSPDVSGDGRLVVFTSFASNLIAGDANGFEDIFLHDRQTHETTIVSVSSAGVQGNYHSRHACIAAGGRFVAFESHSSTLVAGDTNNRIDIFVRDLALGTTTRVSVSSTGAQADQESGYACISADGQRICFWGSATNLVPGALGKEIYMRDTSRNQTYLISQSTAGIPSNGACDRATISANGRVVAFQSWASNLVPGDTNGYPDVFVRTLDPVPPIVYCPAKTNSFGCLPRVSTTGTASASSLAPFWIDADSVLNNKAGLAFYCTTSATMLPFQAGWLCVAPPIRRTPVMNAGGTPPPALDCSGQYHLDFNAWIQGGSDPTLTGGQLVWAQFWSRDPGFPPPNNTGLTGAVVFAIAP